MLWHAFWTLTAGLFVQIFLTTTYAQDLAAPLVQVLQINQDSTYYGLDRLATDIVPIYRQWYLHDALGSTRQTVQGGGTLNAGRYDPWGTPIDNQIAPFGFAGELQGDGGLVYLRARWYTPQQGVFTSRDPFAGWAEQPYSQHYFQYGYSNPVLFTDPSGRCLEGWDGNCLGPLDTPDPLTVDEFVESGSGLIDVTPGFGDVKGLIEVFTGCDLITGEELGHWRWLGLIALSELRLGRRLATAGDVGRGLRGAATFGNKYPISTAWENGVDLLRVFNDSPVSRLRITSSTFKNDIAMRNASNIIPKNGYMYVFVHSDVDEFLLRVGPDEYIHLPDEVVAEIIRNANPHNLKIKLFACHAGACSNGPAQRLANLLGQDIETATTTVRASPDGRYSPDDKDWIFKYPE